MFLDRGPLNSENMFATKFLQIFPRTNETLAKSIVSLNTKEFKFVQIKALMAFQVETMIN